MSGSHFKAVLQAVLVTFLWSSSWVLIKLGLEDIPALTFAGLRYVLAFLLLLPFALRRRGSFRLTPKQWRALALLGLVQYALTQGSQFLALAFLPAQTTSLVLSFTPVLVALLGTWTLAERLTLQQGIGMALYLGGALLYFYPASLPREQLLGLAVICVGVLANAGSSVLGRAVNRGGRLSPLTVTVLSMGVGSVALLVTGIVTQGAPTLGARSWGIIAWLALVNTAFAFTLWNHTLRTLSALESSLINNTMLIQIALLAWVFLGESLSGKELLALGIAAFGTLVVQLRGRPWRRRAVPHKGN